MLQKTPFSFDVSVWEFFWPLMVGAKLGWWPRPAITASRREARSQLIAPPPR